MRPVVGRGLEAIALIVRCGIARSDNVIIQGSPLEIMEIMEIMKIISRFLE